MSKQTDLINIPDAITISGSNVGIGGSPSTQLEVVNNNSNLARVRVSTTSTTAGNYRGYEFAQGNAFKGGLLQDQSNDAISVFTPIGGQSVTINSSGNVGIGTSSPNATLHVSGQTRLEASGEAGPHTYRDGNSGNDIRFFSTNGTFASPTAKTPNSSVGQLHYSGHDGTTYRQNASIVVSVDGTVSTGTVPMRMTFHAGTTTNTERMRIDSSGRVTTPYQPAFWAFSSTYATTGNYPFTNFNISGAGKFNTGNHLNLTSGVFTAPLAGRYQFNGSFHSTSASTTARRIGRFQLNGNSLGEFAESSAQYADIGASIIVNMSANDTMQIITHPWYFDEVDFSGYLIG